MPFVRFFLLRFLQTFGLLFILALLLVITAYQPLKKHVIETQQFTSLKAKMLFLGYQTPDFKRLAQYILERHNFKPEELNNYREGTDYLSFYKKGAELFPELFEMHYMQGICYFWMGDFPAADAALRQSLQVNPVFFWSYYNLGLLYLKNGQIDAAIALLSAAKRIPPEITEGFLRSLETFAIIYIHMPDPQGYIDVNLQQADHNINYLLGIAMAIKDHRGAGIHFDPDQWNPVFF